MKFVRTLALVVFGAVLLSASPVGAQERPADDAASYLRRIAGAGDATYQARQLVVYFGRPQSAAVVDVRSSRTAKFFRAESGTDVTRLWRRSGMGVVSDGGASITDRAPVSVRLRPDAVLAKYEIEVDRPQQMSGVRVVPLALSRRSDRRTVERLWVHERSGIVYRRELYGRSGELVGMSTILDMRWGESAPADPFEPRGRTPGRARMAPPTDAPPALADGYRLLRSYRVTIGDRPADHWVYSDGLHALSVFRTDGGLRAPEGFTSADLGGARGWVGPGPGTWAWEGGGSGWVVIAEEPALDPGRLTASFPKGGPSIWARLGSVWTRGARAIRSVFA